MSAIATSWAWGQQGITPEEKLVLLALAEGANHQGQCWPLKTMLEGMCSMPQANLFACLKGLSEKGLVESQDRAGASPIRVLVLDKTISPRQVVVHERASPPITQTMAAMQDQAMVIWNEMAVRTKAGPKEHWIAAIRSLTKDMRTKLRPRLEEAGLEGWTRCVETVERSAHCRGVNDRKWRADFSYLLQAKGFSKTFNGGWPHDYEELTNGGQRTGPAGRGDQRLDGIRSFDSALRGHLAAGVGREGGGAEDRGAPADAGGGQGAVEPGLPAGPTHRGA